MIVLKKLIAFAAAFSLATPASFAQVAQTPTQARARAKKSKPDAPNKRVASHVWGRRGLASVDEPVARPPSPRTVMVGKQKFLLSERYATNGRLLSTVVVGPDYREIKVDTYGTGTADKWEVTKGLTTMRASSPFYGRFMKMEIEQRRKNGVLVMNLAYQARTKKYKLISKHLERYVTLNADDDLVFGGVCSVSNTQNMDSFRDLVSKLSSTGSSLEDSLLCHIKAAAPLIFDASCLDPANGFAGSVESMERGLAKILASETGGSSEQHRYLSCLDDHGLAEHSSRIQGLLYSLSNAGEQALAKAQPPLSADELSKIGTPEKNHCGDDPALQAKLKLLKPDGNSGVTLIGCAPSVKGSDADAKRGSFTSKYGAQQVVMHATVDKISATMPRKGMDPVDAYASTMFHELVHSSRIIDEKLTLNVEQCCAGTDANSSKSACKNIDKALKPLAQQQRLVGILSLGYTKQSYADASEFVNEQVDGLGILGGSASNTVMTNFEAYVAPRIADDADARAKLGIKDKANHSCPLTGQSTECLQLQTQFTEDRLKEYTTAWLKEQCPVAMQTAALVDAANAKNICNKPDFKQEFMDLVTIGQANGKKGVPDFDVLGNLASNAAIADTSKAKAPTLAELYANGADLGFTDPSVDNTLMASSQTANDANASAVNPVDAAAAISPVAMGSAQTTATPNRLKLDAKVAANYPSNSGGQNGSSSGILTGAQPGTAGDCSGRADFVSCTNYASGVVDNAAAAANTVTTAVGHAILPSAQASNASYTDTNGDIVVTAPRKPAAVEPSDSTGPDIVVVGPKRPRKSPVVASESSSSPSTMPYIPIAAPVISNSTADSSTPDTSIATPNFGSSSPAYIPPVTSTSGSQSAQASRPANDSSQIQAPDLPTQAAQGVPRVAQAASTGATAGGRPSALSSRGTVASSGSGLAPAAKADSRRPSNMSENLSSAPIRTFRDAASMETFLEHDYGKIEYSLNKTKTIQQLIDYKILVRDAQHSLHGCFPSGGCQPALKLDYCGKKRRLVRAGEC